MRAAQACADATAGAGLVILLDDALTGTRFIKLFDALVNRIGRDRFLPIVLRFEDTSRRTTAKNQNWQRLVRRVTEQTARIGYPSPIVDFPPLRLFKMDEGPFAAWESPVIWGNSDLIAGKRKVNLIFTVIAHCLKILEELGAGKSTYRPYLERAWQRDTTGARFLFVPGLVQSVFQKIVRDLQLEGLQQALWHKAKVRFPEDYDGKPIPPNEQGVKERWDWFRDAFIKEARQRLDEQRAALAWRAINDTFAASFPDHKPHSGRDQDDTPYTFPFNPTVCELNLRLRQKILGSSS